MATSSKWNVIEEYNALNSKIPKKYSSGFADISIVITTICFFDHTICLGTQIGLAYLINITNGNVVTLKVSTKFEAITAMSLNCCQYDMLAVGFTSGWTSVLRLPGYQENLDQTHRTYKKLEDPTADKIFKWYDKRLVPHKINTFAWDKKGESLFVGSSEGHIYSFKFNYECERCQVLLLLAVDNPVIQLSYTCNLLAISSETSCYIYNVNTKNLLQCGNNPLRPVRGQFGCVFLPSCDSLSLPVLVTSRAHHRLWLLDSQGIVNWTYIGHNISLCDELLEESSNNVPDLRPSFGKLYHLDDNLIVSFSPKHVIIYNVEEKIPVAYIINNGRFKEVSCYNGTIILLLTNNNICALSLHPKDVFSCLSESQNLDVPIDSQGSIFPWLESQLKAQQNKFQTFKTKILETANEQIVEGLPLEERTFHQEKDLLEENLTDYSTVIEPLNSGSTDISEEIVVKPTRKHLKEQNRPSSVESSDTQVSSSLCSPTSMVSMEESDDIQVFRGSRTPETPVEPLFQGQSENISESIDFKEKTLADALGFPSLIDPPPSQETIPEVIDELEFSFDGLQRLVSTNSSILTEDSSYCEDKVHPSFLKTLDAVQLSDLETSGQFNLPSSSVPSMHSYGIDLEWTSTDNDSRSQALPGGWMSLELPVNAKLICGLLEEFVFSDGSYAMYISARCDSRLQSIVMPKPIQSIHMETTKECCFVVMENSLYSVGFSESNTASSIVLLIEDVVYVTVNGDVIWTISCDGQVLVSKWKERSTFVRLESENRKFVQVASKNGVVWGLTKEGNLLYRVGVEVNGWGVDWAEAPLENKRLTHIHISSHGLGWKVDETGGVFVLPYISQQFPQGLDARWWQVNVHSVSFENEQIFLTSDLNNLWLTQGTSTVYSYPLGSFIGYRWENRIPEELQVIDAGGVHVDHGVLYALKNENNLLMVNPRTLNLVEIPTPMGQPIHCISSRPEALWVLTERGEIYVRDGLGPNLNIGISWIKLDTSQIDDVHLSQISLGLEVVWAVDERGNVFMRQGPLHVSVTQTMPAAWLQIDAPLYVKFKKVFVGAGSHLVWAIDTEQRIYVRQAISSDLATGLSWLGLNDVKAKTITISEDRVFVLSTGGDLYEREGVTSTNYIGDSWTKLPCGAIIDITVSTDNCLWALNEEGRIMQQCILSMRNKLPPASSNLDLITDSEEFEVI